METNDSSLLIEKSKEVDSTNMTNTSSTPEIPSEVEPIVYWTEQALKGNFMPAVVMLDRKEINVEDVVDSNTGNKLIHLAVFRGYLNVVRTLHETFKCNISVVNNYGHSPLHLLCSRFSLDMHLFYFLIKYDPTSLDLKDLSNVTPLFYCVMSKQNIGFLYLVSLGADLYNLDRFENSILYWSLSHNNLFALKFILNHLEIDINSKFNKLNTNFTKDVTDLLISSKSNASCKYICKYQFDKLSLEMLTKMKENLNRNSFYNIKNYEILSIVLHYKQRVHLRPLAMIKILFNLNYRFYGFRLYCTLFLSQMKSCFKALLFVLVASIKYSFLADLNNNYNSFVSLVCCVLILINLILTFMLLFFNRKPKILPACTLRESNVINEVNEKFKTDLFGIFFEEEICEICLIRKDIYTNHCKVCNKCVDQFHFHSLLFNTCVSKHNMRVYFLNELTNLLVCFILLIIFYYRVNDDFPRSNYYFITNLMYAMIYPSFKHIFFSNLLFYSLIYSLQRVCVLLICMGYNTTYYMLFRTHKVKNQNIQIKNKLYYFTVDTNKYTFLEAIINIIRNF